MKSKRNSILIIVLALILISNTAYAKDSTSLNTGIPNNNNGEKWRIGYCESEPFVNYTSMLYSLAEGLAELDWINSIEDMNYSEGQEDSSEMWEWLSEATVSSNIEFVSDAYYSLSTTEADGLDAIKGRLEENDLDLMLVMGTSAGKFITSCSHNTPIMVFATSNAVQAGIIKSETDPGVDNVWAHMDSKRFQRQVSVFHEMFKFKKLGIVCEDSQVARNYSAVDDIEIIAGQKGFEVIYSYVKEPVSKDDEQRYYSEVAQAYKGLSEKVDAMYITVASLDSKKLPEFLTPFYEKKVPVFSQLGAVEVENGALMSITVADFKNTGRFGADKIAKLFNGESLRTISQVFESTPQIIINLKSADKIGYNVPFEVLLAADEIYSKVGDSDETGN
ncbi:MAG: hypothetical protein JJE49_01655 [Peptostreptococcaceae bacterium]|nr:hypothetical protein [Peptostreptococcaceae bacterium]